MRRTITVSLILCLLITFFTACNAPSEILTEGDLSLEIFLDSKGRTETIKTYKNGKRIDTWRLHSSVSYNEAPVTVCDVNFDGHDDLRILVATGKHLRYAHRIYDAATGTFYTDEQLDSMLDVSILPEQKQITAYYRTHTIDPAVGTTPETYIDEQGVNTYEWRDGKLFNVRRECVTYYSESDIYCVATWELNSDGTLEPYDEQWLSPEKYVSEGFDPIS